MAYLIYHDADSRTTVISGIEGVYPEGTLDVEFRGTTKVQVVHRAGRWTVLGPIDYTRIARQDGTGFVSVSECFQYLSAELDKRRTTAESAWEQQDW